MSEGTKNRNYFMSETFAGRKFCEKKSCYRL